MRISNLIGLSVLSAILVASPVTTAAAASARVNFAVTIRIGPPQLPVYAQPLCPGRGYIWVPGYWAYGDDGYFWVPGMWIRPPRVGLLWTPGYWAFDEGYYIWHAGYWGATVGFYGGINYGFGFPGTGFYGGAWNGGNFAYNTAVSNVNTTVIHNTYNKTVTVNNYNGGNRTSFNGGHGGITARPTEAQINSRKNGIAPTTAQVNQAKIAGQDRNQLYSVNKGKPTVTTSQRAFSDTNKPSNFAPVTTADKQTAAKIPTRGHNTAASTTQNKPANAMQNKPVTKPATQAKPVTKPATQAKPVTKPATQAKPVAKPATQAKPVTKPATQPQTRPAGASQPAHRPPTASQPQHRYPTQMPPGHPQGQMHQQSQGARPQGQMHQQGQMNPQGRPNPQGAAHPQGQKPTPGGQRPPEGRGKNNPPRG